MIAFELLALVAMSATAATQSVDYDAGGARVRELLEKMVAAGTVNPPGNEAKIAELVRTRLAQESIGSDVVEFAPGRSNLVARLKGATRKGLLVIAHTDVVGTENQKWTSPPHVVTENNGYLIARGVGDDLGMAAMAIETLILVKQSGLPLKRDLVVALTGDEESGGLGVTSLLKNRPELLEAAIALNEGGGVVLDEAGKVKFLSLQVAEKTYQDIELIARGTTGHSSVPMPDNSITRLGKAIERLSRVKENIQLSPLIRGYLRERSKVEPPDVARAMMALATSRGTPPKWAVQKFDSDPALSATVRSTCVPTMILGGTRVNALPAEVKMNLNCRVLPTESRQALVSRIVSTINDPKIEVKLLDDFESSPESALGGDGPSAIRKIAAQMWPGVPVIPVLAKGATDSRYLRRHGIASYGMMPIALEEADSRRMHGIDERIPVASLRPGLEFFYRLVSELVL